MKGDVSVVVIVEGREARMDLALDGLSEAKRRDVVANAAAALYPKAAGVRIPTPEREGGRG